jgi:branched-chain amino acid transport system permease protein
MNYFLQQFVNGVALGSVYALLALGVTLVWGVLDVLNFAHGQFVTWGTFATAAAITTGHLPVAIAVVVGMVFAALLAAVVERVVIAPLKRRGQGDEFAAVVATIGVSLLLLTLIRDLTSSELRPFPVKGFPSGRIGIGGIELPKLQLVVLATTLAAMVLLGFWLARTRLGRELRAVAYSREISQLLGVNAGRVFALAFAISGALAALAGTFVAVQTTLVSYSTGDQLLTLTFAAVVIGGMGSVPGAVVGGLALGLMEVMLAAYTSSRFDDAFPFLLMALVLLARPTGLFRQQAVARA